MLDLLSVILRTLLSTCDSRSRLLLENLAPRHQIVVLQRTSPKPRLCYSDRILWLVLRHLFLGWQTALFLVQPQTVIQWHRLGFRLFWRWKSRRPRGRPPADRPLISRFAGSTDKNLRTSADSVRLFDEMTLLWQPAFRPAL